MPNLDKDLFVVDCNVAIKWYFQNEDDSDAAFLFLSKAISKKIILLAPSIIVLEFANVISKYSKLNKNYNLIEYFNNFKNLVKNRLLNIVSLSNKRAEVLALAINLKLSYYDAEYLYLSHQLNSKLITFDKQLVKIYQQTTNKN